MAHTHIELHRTGSEVDNTTADFQSVINFTWVKTHQIKDNDFFIIQAVT